MVDPMKPNEVETTRSDASPIRLTQSVAGAG